MIAIDNLICAYHNLQQAAEQACAAYAVRQYAKGNDYHDRMMLSALKRAAEALGFEMVQSGPVDRLFVAAARIDQRHTTDPDS